MNDAVARLLLKINEKLPGIASGNSKLMSLRKVFMLDLGDEKTLILLLGGVANVLDDQTLPPDITVYATTQDIRDILDKKLDPMRAYSSGRIKIKSTFLDKLILAELLS